MKVYILYGIVDDDPLVVIGVYGTYLLAYHDLIAERCKDRGYYYIDDHEVIE